jgi:hypothetical protein
MAITPLLTPAEADVYNTASASWLALSDALKTAHIFNATVYIKAKWNCSSFDWDDLTTFDDDVLRACAYYADADRIGVLTTAVTLADAHGAVTEETRKLGTMLKTTKWAESGNTTGDPLESINSIMGLYCSSNSGRLIRV